VFPDAIVIVVVVVVCGVVYDVCASTTTAKLPGEH